MARPRGHALVSDATWQFPSQAMGTFTWDVSEVSPVEEGDIHLAEKGKAGSDSTTVGGPLNFMLRLPLTGDHADDDLDGVPALLELAFGMDDLSADRSLLPQAILLSDGDSRFVGVSFRRAVGGILDPATLQYTAAGLRYTVQASDDLIAWSDLGADEAQISQATALGNGYESVIVALATPVGEEGDSATQGGRSRFLRVHVERMSAP